MDILAFICKIIAKSVAQNGGENYTDERYIYILNGRAVMLFSVEHSFLLDLIEYS